MSYVLNSYLLTNQVFCLNRILNVILGIRFHQNYPLHGMFTILTVSNKTKFTSAFLKENLLSVQKDLIMYQVKNFNSLIINYQFLNC